MNEITGSFLWGLGFGGGVTISLVVIALPILLLVNWIETKKLRAEAEEEK